MMTSLPHVLLLIVAQLRFLKIFWHAWKSPQYSGAVIRQTFGAPLLSSTPVSSTQKTSNQRKASIENTTVKLSVSYPSKTVNKTLPKDYEALGKSLIHGPPSRIATAVLKCAPLTHLVIEKVLRLLKAEVGDLCSKKNPSSLRNCTKEALINFELEKLCNEWKKDTSILLLPFDGH